MLPCKIEIVPYYLFTEVDRRSMDYKTLSRDILESVNPVLFKIMSRNIMKEPSVSFINAMTFYQKKRLASFVRKNFKIKVNKPQSEDKHEVYVYSGNFIEGADFVYFFSMDTVELRHLLKSSKKLYIFLPSNKDRYLFHGIIRTINSLHKMGKLPHRLGDCDFFDYSGI